jgi:hypothetical protein
VKKLERYKPFFEKVNKDKVIEEIENYVEENSRSLPHWADTIAVRFDNKKFKVGHELKPSKDYKDTRDFPEYDKDYFDTLDNLPGTSAYFIAGASFDKDEIRKDNIKIIKEHMKGRDYKYANIVIGKEVPDTVVAPEDDGEVILEYATVVKNLY